MKSPIEEFAEAKKSGAYAVHPETERNWPSDRDPKPSPIDEEKPEKVRTYTNTEKEIEDIKAWLFVLTAIVLVMLGLMIAEAFKTTEKTTAATQPFKEAPPKVVYKTRVVNKTKVKKVYVAQSDKWRKRLCYNYGDWNACTAYKKNLPFRARVGRSDLN